MPCVGAMSVLPDTAFDPQAKWGGVSWGQSQPERLTQRPQSWDTAGEVGVGAIL